MENNAQLLKGVLEYCVLKLIAQEPTYGYEIVMHLKQVGFSDLSESTLYPLLLRLEQQAFLEFRQDWSQLCQLVEKIFKEESDE